MKLNVLDHGSVELIDFMGSDLRVLQAARVSTASHREIKTEAQNKGLINYLVANKHWSPFEQVCLTFHVKLPIFVARQWMRHRTWSYNEISARYTKLETEFYEPVGLRAPGLTNHQGSVNFAGDDAELLGYLKRSFVKADTRYKKLISGNVANELARVVLPVGVYTEFYCTVNLRNLLHFLELRLHTHAQYEIRVYADAILSILENQIELSYTINAWKSLVLNGRTMSEPELAFVRGILLNSSDFNKDVITAELGPKGLDRMADVFRIAFKDRA